MYEQNTVPVSLPLCAVYTYLVGFQALEHRDRINYASLFPISRFSVGGADTRCTCVRLEGLPEVGRELHSFFGGLVVQRSSLNMRAELSRSVCVCVCLCLRLFLGSMIFVHCR